MPSYANQTVRLQQQSLPVFPTQSSFHQLFGDTFATNSANSLYLLGDINSAIAGTDLTNNNAVTFPLIEDLLIKPVNVSEFNGVDQFLSLPTEASVEVGLGSFVASCWFKSDGGSSANLFQYGDLAINEQFWRCNFNGNGALAIHIDDGTTQATVNDTVDNKWNDNKWHIVSMFVDRTTTNLMTLFVDGEFRNSSDISTVTGTLDNVGQSLRIGSAFNGAPSTFYAGQLANFSLYFPDTTGVLPPDYNLPSILNAGIRESASVLAASFTLAVQSLARINNNFGFSSGTADGDYTTSVINTSEGIYDLITLHRIGVNDGIAELQIDGETVQTFDGFGTADWNINKTDTGIYLSAGTHILKYKINGQNVGSGGFASRSQIFELIKRDGEATDGDSTGGVLFGDELQQEANDTDWELRVRTTAIYNSEIVLLAASSDVGDFTQGNLFLKRGLYKWTVTYRTTTSAGTFNVNVGGVTVLSVNGEGATADNNQQTAEAFIEGGLSPVEILITGAGGSDSQVIVNSIRYELVSGKSEGDDVHIWAADDDMQIVSGGSNNLTPDGTVRFNVFKHSASPLNGDEDLTTRYFSGGTYKVIYNSGGSSQNGLLDMFWDVDTNLIFDNIDPSFGGALTIHSATVTIPRGFHNIHRRIVGAGGNAGGFDKLFMFIQFTLIEPLIDAELDDNSDGTEPAFSTVPLDANNEKITIQIELDGTIQEVRLF